MSKHNAARLDDELEGRASGAGHDAETDLLASLAHSIRFSAAEEMRMRYGDGEGRALQRLRSATQAQRASVTSIASHPRWRMPRVQFPQPVFARVAMAAAVIIVGTALVAGPGALGAPLSAAARTLGLSGSSSTKAEAPLAPAAGNPLASGRAKSEQRTDRTRFALEVEDASTTGTHAVRVTRRGATVDNTAGLTIKIDSFGAGELEMNTQDGATGVPVVLAGDLVEVVDGDGNVILSGTLQPK
jgi:hypothetical protein